jgi:hypothetical protein
VEFSQELVKICTAANFFDFRVYFGISGRYKQPVQYGRDSAHKSRAGWAVFSLGVYMTERQHIYEDLKESSSASPGGSQQLEIPPSPNSKRPPTFSRSADISPALEISTPAKILSTAYISAGANILQVRQHFVQPPVFWKTPTFCKSANVFMRRQHFGNPPIFS